MNYEQDGITDTENSSEVFYPLEDIVNEEQLDILFALGFEEGELEYFFNNEGINASYNELINRYLEINYDFFDTLDEAINADYNIDNSNMTKHDLAQATLDSFNPEIGGKKTTNKRKQIRNRRTTNKKK